MLDIVMYGEDVLTQKAESVREFGPDIAQLVADMLDAMRRGKGIGLAGPQVGRSLRVFVTQVDGDKPRAFINPEIVLTSQNEVDYEEGCLSLPGLYVGLHRPESVRIQAWNEKGRPFTTEADGLLARVMLHEYDHLDGILFIDRLSPAKREKVLGQYRRMIRM
jgi:peptide deformylase